MPELSTLGPVIKVAYEDEEGTNAFTDAERAKLASVATGADVAPVRSVNGQTGSVSLDASAVGALPDTYSPPPAPVQSVHGKTGNVVLTAADVGALGEDYTPPAAPVQSVNGQTGNVEITAGSLGALTDDYSPPVTSVNGQQGDISITATSLGALTEDYEPPVTSVNGQDGAVNITAESINAMPDDYTAPVLTVNGQTGNVSLNAADIGALADDYTPPAPPVTSVNGQTGDVLLNAGHVNALPSNYTPTILMVTGLQAALNEINTRLEALENAEPGPDPDPDPEVTWFDGGWPAGYTSKVVLPPEGSITTIEADNTTYTDDAVENAPSNVRFVLEPGNYVNAGQYQDYYVGDKPFIHIVGKNAAWLGGAPNPNGTRFSGFTSWINGTIVFENLIFDKTSDMYDSLGGPDYALYLHRETNVIVKNCVFAGQYIHDISFKRAEVIGEIVGCYFRHSERHSIEIGQECHYFSDETQVENVYIVGNDFADNVINCITIQASKNVFIDNNRFHNAGRVVRTVTFNKTPNADVKLLTPPMRTEFTNNEITGTNWSALWFTGRGRADDTLYFHGNDGLLEEDVILDPLHPDDGALFTAAGNAPDSHAAPTVDPNSDILGSGGGDPDPDPEPEEDAPVVEGYIFGASSAPQTEHVIPLPSGFRVNERIYVYLTVAASEELTPPAGWDVIYATTNQLSGLLLTRQVDGNEGASITVTGTVARNSSYVAVRVSRVASHEADWYNTQADDPTTAAVPPLTPTAGNQNYLWLTAAHWRQGTRVTTPPSGFTAIASGDTGFVGAAENHISVAQNTTTGTSITPGDWTSNQVDTELNNYISSILGVVGGGPAPGSAVNPPAENQAPVATDDVNSTTEDTPLNVNAANGVLANDSDPNDDTLTVSAVNGVAGNVGSPVEGNNGGLFTIAANGSYTFDPDGDFDDLFSGDSTATSVTYTVSDGELTDTATLTITVNGVGTPPTLEAPSIVSTNFGNNETSTTNYQVVLPPNIVAGNRLFVFFSAGASDTYTMPTGWDQVYWTTNQTTAICLTRIADGSEGATVEIVGSVARYATYCSVQIEGAGDFEPDWLSTGDHPTTAGVPVFPAAGGVQNYLWLATVHWRQGSRTVAAPSGYTIATSADTEYDGAAESHITVAYIVSETDELPAANWTSNEVSPDLNNFIVSLIAIAPE